MKNIYGITQGNKMRYITLILLMCSCLSYGQLFTQLKSYIDIVVAKDGSGNYTTVKAAIDAASSGDVIFIRNGTYTEKIEIPSSKSGIWIIGEDVNKTVISYNDYSGSGKIYNGIISTHTGTAIGTSTSHTLLIQAEDFTMMNISVANTAGDVGQAVAVNSNSDREVFYHCRFLGRQDTYYTWKGGRLYLSDCYIEGTVDYIFGRAVTFFENNLIHSLRSGSSITAASTDQGYKFGYLFKNCKLTAASGVSKVTLGRPWRPYCQTVFMNCEQGSFLNSAGWSEWSGNSNHTTCYYAEYKNCGGGSATSNRVSWSEQLTDVQAATYTMDNMFKKDVGSFSSDWTPTAKSNPIYTIIKNAVTPFVTEACFGITASKDCAGVENGTATKDNCDRCVGGNTGKIACVASGEAETDACSFDGAVEDGNLGFKGTGFVNVYNVLGSKITFHVNVATAGSKTLSFRYANGGTTDRPANIQVNGTASGTLSFPVTGSFTTYLTTERTFNLNVGLNTIELSSSTAEGLANIDQIGYVSTGLGMGSCVVTSLEVLDLNQMISVYPNPSNATFQVNLTVASNIQAFDLEGKILEEHNDVTDIEFGLNLKPGMYFLKIDSKVYKLFKE